MSGTDRKMAKDHLNKKQKKNWSSFFIQNCFKVIKTFLNLNQIDKQDIITPGVWKKLLYSEMSYDSTTYHEHINFYVSDEEVRLKNIAVKIWKRIQ